MRLERYIKESKDYPIYVGYSQEEINNTIDTIKKDCSNFLKESNGFLYRATNKKLGIMGKVMPRQDRRPVDTPRDIHELADKLFKEKFGWKVRSEGVFTATRLQMTQGYGGNTYIVFPLNGYRYVWSEKINDFYISQSDYKKEYGKNMEDLVGEYTNKNLKNVWSDRRSREVIFNCPKGYYLVDVDMIDILSDRLGIDFFY